MGEVPEHFARAVKNLQTPQMPQAAQAAQAENWHYTDLTRLLAKDTKSIFVDGVPPDVARLATLADDGGVLDIDTTPARPIHLMQNGDDLDLHHHIKLAAGVCATLIVSTDAAYANLVRDIELARDAALTLVVIQTTGRQIGLTRVVLAEDSRLTHVALITGGALARHEMSVALTGRGAHVGLYGAVLGRGNNHADITAQIEHCVADTTSETKGFYVLDGAARGVFQGKIVVARDAQHIDGQMQARAIMLSDGAEMDAKPELEIYADDVVCAHGTAIGELDADALFFLRARGIGEVEARRLLIAGFMEQILVLLEEGDVTDVLRDHLNEAVRRLVEAA